MGASEDMITRAEFDSFKTELVENYKTIDRKLDKLSDPQTGIYATINTVQTMSEKAHTRLDDFGKSFERVKLIVYGPDDNSAPGLREDVKALKDHSLKATKIARYIVVGISSPILAGLGYMLFEYLSHR